MGTPRYARPSDIITSLATITVSGASVIADTAYGLASLYDRNPAIPTKFDGSGPMRLVFDYGTAHRIDGMALPNSNLEPGLALRAELNSADSWVSPAVTVAMPPGDDDLMGHRASPWADFTAASGYSVLGFRYASLYIPANTADIQLGELLVLAQLREFSYAVQFGGDKGAKRRVAEGIETEYGSVRILRRKIKQRLHRFTVKGSTQDYEDFQAIADDAGGAALPWFFAWDHEVKTDGGLYARFTPDTAGRLTGQEEWFDVDVTQGEIIEVSRSLPLI